ncbi:MAG: tRNA 2-thiocytidine biosynthesis protein TtcA [Clostridia bacterium]|nr:tRNA 2-thiocytidine biosynthesis protein TtcA [Clostridia bacterium]
MERAREIERSLQRKFRKTIMNRFVMALNEYALISPGDKIACCISGGKDSMLMAKLFQEIKRHNKFPFEVEFLVMDPGYTPENRRRIEENLALLDIPATIFETHIFTHVDAVTENPCYLCARQRRGWLYKKAQERGCNKIALGHHYDDVIETILMGMLYGGQAQTMMPKLHSQNFEGMELIRPLYFVREADILHWCRYNELTFLDCACRMTERRAGEDVGKRQEIKHLLEHLRQNNPQVDANIFNSVVGVNLETVISYRKGEQTWHFLDQYDTKKEENS